MSISGPSDSVLDILQFRFWPDQIEYLSAFCSIPTVNQCITRRYTNPALHSASVEADLPDPKNTNCC